MAQNAMHQQSPQEDSCLAPCHGWRASDVEQRANAGSYDKALSLLNAGAVKVLIHCADGAVELSVQSERCNDVYEVRVVRKRSGEAHAKCSCVDFRRRGGMCKHGAAALLHLILDSKSAPSAEASAAPVRTIKRSIDISSRPSRDLSSSLHFIRTMVATPARSDLADAMSRRSTKRKSNDEDTSQDSSASQDSTSLDEDEVPEHASTQSAVPKPCFPQARLPSTTVADTSSTSGAASGLLSSKRNEQKSRLKAAMATRLLQNHATAGNGSAFASELLRWTGPLTEVSALLHRAALGDDEAGALAIVDVILDRPEASDALDSARGANGRTLMHAAVASQRLKLCRRLLERKADVNIKDASGLTAMDLAKARKIEVSSGKLEDPFVVLLQEHKR